MAVRNKPDAIAALPNLGPYSAVMLRKAGIGSVAKLRRLGAARAYWVVKKKGLRPSLNLLYALAGALTGTHWTKLPRDEKGALLLEVDALEDRERRHGR